MNNTDRRSFQFTTRAFRGLVPAGPLRAGRLSLRFTLASLALPGLACTALLLPAALTNSAWTHSALAQDPFEEADMEERPAKAPPKAEDPFAEPADEKPAGATTEDKDASAPAGDAVTGDAASDKDADTAANKQPAAAGPEPSSGANAAAVAAIRQSAPKSAGQLMRAVDLLLRLDRADVAQEYWQQLTAMQLSDEQKSQLAERFGTAALLRLSRSSGLTPEPAAFVAGITTAVRTLQRDPQRLADAAELLGSGDRRQQYEGALRLARAGAYAVPAVVRKLATTPRDEENRATRAAALETLQKIGPDAIDALVAYQKSVDAAERTAALQGLGATRQHAALPHLVRPLLAPRADGAEHDAAVNAWQQILGKIPDQHEAIALLEKTAARAYDDAPPSSPVAGELLEREPVTRWSWSAAARQPVARAMQPSESATLDASRLYHDLLAVRPGHPDDRERYLASRLELEVVLRGFDAPLRRDPGSAYAEAARQPIDLLGRILTRSMQDGHEGAAIGVCEVLGATEQGAAQGGPEQESTGRGPALQSGPNHFGPLAMALTHPNPRIRFAATQALARLNPVPSFAGRGHYEDSVRHFASSIGKPVAVVAHPRLRVAQYFAGLLREFGYEAVAVTSARDLVKQATRSPDVELILLSDALNDETTWTTLELLQSGPKTARVPVGILSRAHRLDDMQQIADDHGRAIVVVDTVDKELLAPQVARLRNLAGRDLIPVSRRIDQATMAQEWLSREPVATQFKDNGLTIWQK